MTHAPKISAAAAAAILSTRKLDSDARRELDDARYWVHPHVATVDPNEPALLSYLEDIYDADRRPSFPVSMPQAAEFRALRTATDIVAATRALAQRLREAMEPKSAKPGIIFTFVMTLERRKGFGVIKADLEEDQRYFLDLNGEVWDIAMVRDILPSPQTKYAKYAIVPQPRGTGDAGIRDKQADPDSAADYFLAAIGAEVPLTTGSKLALAHSAMRSGYGENEIVEKLGGLQADEAVETIVEREFPDMSDNERTRLRGSPQRPLRTVRAADRLVRTFSTTDPTFELRVDERIAVTINGNVVSIELPPDHSPISRRFGRSRD